MFEYPIGLLLFNRPAYAEEVLLSLRNQTKSIDEQRIVIYIDGYDGSKDEAFDKPNYTKEVSNLAKEYFPLSRIQIFKKNQGIGRAFSLLEEELFSMPNSQWALFLEEDFVLYPEYLNAVSRLIDDASDQSEIAVISATGDTRIRDIEDVDLLYPLDHLWAFALRKDHYLQRAGLLQPFYELITGVPYWKRDREKITRTYSDLGIFLIGSSQDYVKRALLSYFGKLAVTPGRKYGAYIGAHGEHYEENIFHSMGYGARPVIPETFIESSQNISSQISRLFSDTRRGFADDALQCTVIPLIAAEKIVEQQKESIEMLVRENAILREDSARLNYEVMDFGDRLTNILESTSWKVTRPLRALSKLLRRK